MIILGLNAYHADAAAIVIDGRLDAAAEEERFRWIKHWAGFPTEAIRYCLSEAGVSIQKVDHIAISRDPRAHFWQKAWFAISRRSDPAHILDPLRNRSSVKVCLDELGRRGACN